MTDVTNKENFVTVDNGMNDPVEIYYTSDLNPLLTLFNKDDLPASPL